MPDLPTRKEREKEVAAALLLFFQMWEVQADSVSGLEPPTEEEIADGVAGAVAVGLAITHAEAAIRLAVQQGYATSLREIQRNSQDWARQHGIALGALVAKTTQTGLDSGKSLAELLSAEKADLIATTEVTRAVTMGEALVLVLMLDELGKRFDAIWYTRPELSRTGPCPVCRPLHGVFRHIWQLVAPGGPPAHPECVCNLEYEEIVNV